MSIFCKNYRQGIFYPKNPSKCLNVNGEISARPPEYRSSWEYKLMEWCDIRERVLKWGSEIHKIEYYSEVDGKIHRYFIDFYYEINTIHNGIKKYAIEVKPNCQIARLDEHGNVIYPDPPKKKTQKSLMQWQERCNVIRINNCKWQAARKWCQENGYIFEVLSEEDVGSWASQRNVNK